MELFRGDNIFNNKTEPGLYRNNGIRAKAFGSNCNPENIELFGLLESIRKHVKPESNQDKNYYDVTDFLSFSVKKERALFWCRDKDRLILEKADDYDETRYLFKFTIDDYCLQEFGDGIYSYNFCCNPKLKTSDSGEEPHLSALRIIHYNQVCPICNNQDKIHRLLLINTFEFLKKNAKHAKYEGAIESVEKYNEWLALPFDPLGIHRSSRIPRADFWIAEHYKVIGETRPQLNYL